MANVLTDLQRIIHDREESFHNKGAGLKRAYSIGGDSISGMQGGLKCGSPAAHGLVGQRKMNMRSRYGYGGGDSRLA